MKHLLPAHTASSYPLVSVIIPSYNHAPYLRERIDSVEAQDYPNFEIIILDDCSPDNSREIIMSYENSPHVSRIIINPSNSGNTFLQWDRGMALARGEYIWIAESDDKSAPDFLSSMMSKLMDNDDAVMAFSWSHIIDAQGREVLPNVWDCRSRMQHGGIYDGRWFCRTRMLYYNAVYNASMVVFRKKFTAAVSDDYKQYRYSGDYLFWIEMMLQGRVIEVPERLNYFRQHDRKVSGSKLEASSVEDCEVVERCIRLLHLGTYGRMCLKGKYLKRWKRSQIKGKDTWRSRYPGIYGGNFLHISIYTFDKLIGMSRVEILYSACIRLALLALRKCMSGIRTIKLNIVK